MKLVVTAFVTLDGVIEAPGFDEHRDGRNAWALRVQNDDDGRYNRWQAFSADAYLLGRKTYQIWAAFWPTATGDEELAERVNGIPKYVVSNTLKRADWSNSTLISGDVVGQVIDLKGQPGGDLVVYGSADLVDLLLEHDLVDEYRLLIYPTILGSGKHMFRDGIDTHYLQLVGTQTFSSGVVLLTYQPQREEPTSRYVADYAWTQEQVRSLQAAQDIDRVLASVMFTDLVDSTGRAAELGDRAWRRLIDRHDEVARSEVDRWMGRSRQDHRRRSAGHLRCANQGAAVCLRSPRRPGSIGTRDESWPSTPVRSRCATPTSGASPSTSRRRALGSASANQVVVTRTVLELATGTDLGFDPLGSVSLRGVPGQWELFAASLT